jgi:2,5-dihydroxypyridine 5,6-dioxygenase
VNKTFHFNVLLASTGMLHCHANFAAMAAGIRICRVPEGEFDFLGYTFGRMYSAKTGKAYLGYRLINFAKDENRSGNNLLYYLFPTGEFNVAPVEGSANGTLVIDLTMHHIGRLLTPIELTVEQGRVTKIDGGAEARILRDYLEEYGDDNAYMCPAEASVGVNAKAIVRGIQREDKNIMGTLHFGLGTDIHVGGSVKSKIHMDGVILHPTLYVDGVKRIDNGDILVPIEGN